MEKATFALTGVANLVRQVEFAGRTDRQIARDLLVAAGTQQPTRETVDALVAKYVEFLEQEVQLRAYLPLPGVRETVVALRDRGATLVLGTGNVRSGAHAKLRSAAVDDLFDMSIGGYGDDADSRDELLRVGATRADPSARLPIVIVGDTPHDVSAAHAIGAVCIAVSTGTYSAEQLRNAGSDHIVPVLSPTIASIIERIAICLSP